LRLSERRIYRVLGQHQSTQRRVPTGPDDEERLTADLVELAAGTAALVIGRSPAGWIVNDKWVERI
jgi:putative transposase